MSTDYREFLTSKRRSLQPMGFEPYPINRHAFEFQSDGIRWAVRRGRAAFFWGCGLGKTIAQLEWGSQVYRHTGKPIMLHCPIGIRQQTLEEAQRFGIEVPIKIVNDASEVIPGINLTNYDKLHRLDPSMFAGVVLDESSCLKSFSGSTKQAIIKAYSRTPYRLACTATPAPNDYMELGNHAEFLGVMPSNEMLSRWFINDTMKAGGYRLMRHAEADFFDWMASWAMCLNHPSDLGYDGTGYDLPPLVEHEHVVDPPHKPAKPGFLFDTSGISATTMHAEKRDSAPERAAKVAELVNADKSTPWIVWCDTDYEADELAKRIPDGIEVRGSMKESLKEGNLHRFATGQARVIITKPTIAGFGANWQHCCHVAFVGLSYSYEQLYQAIRRSWRFGQTKPVHQHIVTTPVEHAMYRAIRRKAADHDRMIAGMIEAMKRQTLHEIKGERERDRYLPTAKMVIPDWLSGNAGGTTIGNENGNEEHDGDERSEGIGVGQGRTVDSLQRRLL